MERIEGIIIIDITLFPTSHTFFTSPVKLCYPMVWYGANLPLMHRHQCTQYDNPLARVWNKADEDGMKTTSYSDSVLSRVVVDLSVYSNN